MGDLFDQLKGNAAQAKDDNKKIEQERKALEERLEELAKEAAGLADETKKN